jgi:hypothetical protein
MRLEGSSAWRTRAAAEKQAAIEAKRMTNDQIPMTSRCASIRLLVIGAWSLVIHLSGDLMAAGLVPVGTQPHGGLSGKIVYTHGGHGITAANEGDGKWTFQRGEGHNMIEDLGNIDQMALLVDYLFRAGATVVPLRPVGRQVNEVVLDNDDAGVTFDGSWTDSHASVFFGSAGDVPCREAGTSQKETAHARYKPNIPAAGFYPVYAWTPANKNAATDQLYRVSHAGGITEVTVNHRRVCNGPVYLGTYYFESGMNGYVDVSNRSSDAGSIVVADMIRFGNGMGDIDRGGGKSGLSRQDEAGLYWVQWHVDRSQGIPTTAYRETNVDRQATISLSPRYAAFMNQEADGRLQDRVFVSFHSNAGGGQKARGTLGLFNGNNDKTTATPNQLLLAKSLAKKVNDDLIAQNGQFEHEWKDRHDNVTLDRDDIEFGEINNHYINDEFDATIVEVAFHDNKEDAELLRDPKVRDAIARATYHGLIDYFGAVDGNKTPATAAPAAVTGVYAESNEAGSVTISWLPTAANSYSGDPATSYRVYASTDGYGFDGGMEVTGKDMPSVALSGYDPKIPHFFKVVAVNEGGESPPSEVVAALPSGGPKQVLIVNGFDRLDRDLNPKQPFGKPGNTVDRVRPRDSNSRDYVVQAASAIHAAAPDTHIASTSNEAVANGAVKLGDYKAVVWILGEESTPDHMFGADEQEKVEPFIAGGGNLFVSGSDIGGPFASDDEKKYDVTGAPGGIFEGLSFSFGVGSKFYDFKSPDAITLRSGAQAALNYADGTGAAGTQIAGTGGRGNVVMFAFPFETITTAEHRAQVVKRVLDFFPMK